MSSFDTANDKGREAAQILGKLVNHEFKWDEGTQAIVLQGEAAQDIVFLLKIDNIRSRGGIGESRVERDKLSIQSFDLERLKAMYTTYSPHVNQGSGGHRQL